MPLADLVPMLERKPPHQTKGTAVFLTADPDNAPTALLHSLKHYQVLHERNIILTVKFVDEAHVPTVARGCNDIDECYCLGALPN